MTRSLVSLVTEVACSVHKLLSFLDLCKDTKLTFCPGEDQDVALNMMQE